MSLRLTKEQRAALLAHEPPDITGEGTCPLEPGDTVRVSSKAHLVIEEVRRRRKGGWSLLYVLVDNRDQARILKRVPRPEDFDALRKTFDEQGYPRPLTEDEIRKAARESAYSSAPSSLSDAGEAVDELTQERLTKEAAERLRALQGEDRDRKDLRSALERLKRLARAQKGDQSALAIIERHIEEIERELKQRAA